MSHYKFRVVVEDPSGRVMADEFKVSHLDVPAFNPMDESDDPIALMLVNWGSPGRLKSYEEASKIRKQREGVLRYFSDKLIYSLFNLLSKQDKVNGNLQKAKI